MPTLRCVVIRCPYCGRPADAMACNGLAVQDVRLAEHLDNEGKVCAGGVVTVRASQLNEPIPKDSGVAIDSRLVCSATTWFPPIPPLDNTPIEQIEAYAQACPFSTLISLIVQVDRAAKAFQAVSGIFAYNARGGPDDELEQEPDHPDELHRRSVNLAIHLHEVLRDRVMNGIRSKKAYSDNLGSFTFVDEASGEYVEIPLDSIRVRPAMRAEPQPPRSL